MAKRLTVLMGTLALLIFAVGPPSAEAQYDGAEVSATGYLSPVSPPGAYSHLLNDEATGEQYLVRSDAVDLGSYDDGQRVTVSGTLVSGAETVLEATSVEEAEETGQAGEAAAFYFELSVEDEPPEDATFFGNIQTGEGGPGIFVPLADPEGDGVYTGSTTIPDRFPPGLRPLPPDAEPLEFPVRIVQGTGTNPNAAVEAPGEPITVLKDFGTVPLQEENAFSASLLSGGFGGDTSAGGGTTMGETPGGLPVGAFEDGGDPEGGVDLNEDGVVDEADAALAAETSSEAADTAPEEPSLPFTGGAALPTVLPAGALLAGGLLLLRRAPR